jgi:5-methyltetrahydrofolate--homocysteine methyltransferase
MKELPMKSQYLDALKERVLVYDGAMGTNIQRFHLTPEDFGGKALEGCNDHLVLTRPDVIQSIHESFLAVGCDVVETCTFQSTPHRLREWGIEEKTHELNVKAAQLGRAACAKFDAPGKRRFVAGSIGPTGMLPSSSDPVLSQITFKALEDTYYAQAKALIEGGVDVLLVETAQDILEVKAAIAGFERLFVEFGFRIPIQAQVTLDTSGRMLLGTGARAHARAGALSHRARDAPDLVHPERGIAAEHRHRRRRVSARADADGADARRIRA